MIDLDSLLVSWLGCDSTTDSAANKPPAKDESRSHPLSTGLSAQVIIDGGGNIFAG